MNAQQVQEATQEAESYERQRSRVCDDEGDAAVIQAAMDEHKEWRRIGHLMTELGLTAYHPDHDPIVQRRQRWEQRARPVRATAVPEVPAEDPHALTLLTALRRAGLQPTEADHHTAHRLAHLDPHTIATISGWIEAAHTTALRRTAPPPPSRPVVRRPPIRPEGGYQPPQ
ncbi:hypothetical protein ACIA8O_39025 [Kitasatospora sp. NPDC051853]|uniref:hypothetical protein n=1 Tax=Kitasatospora sp. NPDC051853 TaxID=3364058 RepID=UPI0037A9AE8E